MKSRGSPIRIAVNTMRSRLTVLGFNVAIIAFQLTHLSSLRYGTVVQGFDAPLHLPTALALYFALSLSLAAMVLLLASGSLSEDGACDSPAIIAGDLLTYLALAYTALGFFQPLVTDIGLRELPTSQETAEFRRLLGAISISTALIWVLGAYVGPAVSLLRSPFSLWCNLTLATAHIGLVIVLSYFIGLATELQAMIDGQPASRWRLLRLLFVPSDWLAPILQ